MAENHVNLCRNFIVAYKKGKSNENIFGQNGYLIYGKTINWICERPIYKACKNPFAEHKTPFDAVLHPLSSEAIKNKPQEHSAPGALTLLNKKLGKPMKFLYSLEKTVILTP